MDTLHKVARVRDEFEARTFMPATQIRVSQSVHEALRGEFNDRPLLAPNGNVLDGAYRAALREEGDHVYLMGMRYSVDLTFGDMDAIVVEGDHPFDDSEGAQSFRAFFEKMAEYGMSDAD